MWIENLLSWTSKIDQNKLGTRLSIRHWKCPAIYLLQHDLGIGYELPRGNISRGCLYKSFPKHDSSSSMVLQPNVGPSFLNPPPPNISVLCRPSSVLAFQHSFSIPVHCIYPSSSASPFCVPFESFLGYPPPPPFAGLMAVCIRKDLRPASWYRFS
jgi:hypothetical protein